MVRSMPPREQVESKKQLTANGQRKVVEIFDNQGISKSEHNAYLSYYATRVDDPSLFAKSNLKCGTSPMGWKAIHFANGLSKDTSKAWLARKAVTTEAHDTFCQVMSELGAGSFDSEKFTAEPLDEKGMLKCAFETQRLISNAVDRLHINLESPGGIGAMEALYTLQHNQARVYADSLWLTLPCNGIAD
jgi:hypothetical protein